MMLLELKVIVAKDSSTNFVAITDSKDTDHSPRLVADTLGVEC